MGPLLAGALLVPVLWYYSSKFLPRMDKRAENVRLEDPVLKHLPIVNTSNLVNGVTWGAISLFTYEALKLGLVHTPLAYLLFVLTRMLCMWSCPLLAPLGIIPLADPFQNGLAGTLTNDLFFSGHLGTIAMFFFLGTWKVTYFCAGSAVSVLMLLSRVHYTVDLIVAPMAAYCAVSLAQYL